MRNNSETKEKHGKKDTIRLRFLLVLYGFFFLLNSNSKKLKIFLILCVSTVRYCAVQNREN